jgi:hypothetical protein
MYARPFTRGFVNPLNPPAPARCPRRPSWSAGWRVRPVLRRRRRARPAAGRAPLPLVPAEWLRLAWPCPHPRRRPVRRKGAD